MKAGAALYVGLCVFFFNEPPATEIYTLSLHDALPISNTCRRRNTLRHRWNRDKHRVARVCLVAAGPLADRWQKLIQNLAESRSEEHTSELQSQFHLVCRLLLEKKNQKYTPHFPTTPSH